MGARLETSGAIFPPLFRGEGVAASVDPFDKAVALALQGTDPGLIVHHATATRLEAAIILAPECPLEDAMAMVFAASLGFGDALGALAPPEVGVHMVWPGTLRVNGARCANIRAAAATKTPEEIPDWLVIGLTVRLFPERGGLEAGETPDVTSLVEEGCGLIPPTALLESWARHMLVWINTWLDSGMAPLHRDWRSRAFDMGEDVEIIVNNRPTTGTFMGLDGRGGLLLRQGKTTTTLPLSQLLEAT